MNKRFSGVLAAVFLALAIPAGSAHAGYPEKTVSMVVPFPPGGRTDLVARLVGQYMSKQLAEPVVIVNKGGAGGVLGSKDVARAHPDGYTLGFFSTAVVTAQYTVPTPTSLGDYVGVSVVNIDPMALAVRQNAPWKDLKELVAYGREHPKKLRVGMIPGASAQIFAAAFAKAANLQVTYVPFKGDADGAAALAGGHIDVHVAVPVSYNALVDAGKVRMLGVAAESRSPMYADLPTFRENGVDLVIGSFHAVYAPRDTPRDVLLVLENAAQKAMRDPALLEQMKAAGLGHASMNLKESAAFIADQDAVYREVIEAAGMRVTPR